ncbi:hypothetical protein VPHD260_0211 [Vibrio phage D260]
MILPCISIQGNYWLFTEGHTVLWITHSHIAKKGNYSFVSGYHTVYGINYTGNGTVSGYRIAYRIDAISMPENLA